MSRRVVVTGLGLICAVGNTSAETWSNLLAGKSGVAQITGFDSTGFACTIAADVKNFDDLRRLRDRRGISIFTIAPHPFYFLGGSIGSRLLEEIDCFDAIELCHFHKGLLNPNRRAAKVASRFGKPLVATSDAHQLHAFGRHYTSIPRPAQLTTENVFVALRAGRIGLTSPPCSFVDLASAIYFIFLAHPFRRRRNKKRRFATPKAFGVKNRPSLKGTPVLNPNRKRDTGVG